ncbi:MAG: SDR family oxidoreductase [Deltaproteobacteria bacterium]|nr:SDR family oxidoreductase [Deltaproteobacteria bacterium]
MLKGKTALVTGASSGLGRSFANLLAAKGADLVITARRGDRLKTLAGELETKHGSTVTIIPLDLSMRGAAAELFERTEAAETPVEILVNNAGFATLGTFLDTACERSAELLAVNMKSPTELCWRLGRAMRERGSGRILNVASFASFTPVPNMAIYAASKAYVRNFSEALSIELDGTGVHVCALCPGPVATDFYEVAGRAVGRTDVPAGAAGPDEIAGAGLDALFAGKRLCLPVAKDHMNAFFMRLLPRGFVMKMAGKEMGLHKTGGEE